MNAGQQEEVILTAKDRNDLRHLALIVRANEHDGVAVEISQDRVIATVERIVAEGDAIERLGQIAALHHPITEGPNEGFCDGCEFSWPCPTRRLAHVVTPPGQRTDGGDR